MPIKSSLSSQLRPLMEDLLNKKKISQEGLFRASMTPHLDKLLAPGV